MLCLATYNIWNSKEGMPFREKSIVKELKKINPDIICLQEVSDKELAERIATELEMESLFSDMGNKEEGLCILYKYPMKEYNVWVAEGNAIYACFEIQTKKVGIANLHLPWDSILLREKSILSVIEKLNEKKTDYCFILGDFNCGDHSDVIRMLQGDCLIQGVEAKPCFYDLALASSQTNGTAVKATLNFKNNPRFTANTIEINQRFDRILLKNTYPEEFPFLLECDIFGTKIYEETGLAASDHYGVYAKLDFKEEKMSEDIWQSLYDKAKSVQNGRVISPFIEAGGVAAAILTKKGNIYVGVCIDTASTLGMCAERNAIANMITNGEHQIDKLVAVTEDGSVGAPCGACREYMMQLDQDSGDIEILMDFDSRRTVRLRDLIPEWWGKDNFKKFVKES